MSPLLAPDIPQHPNPGKLQAAGVRGPSGQKWTDRCLSSAGASCPKDDGGYVSLGLNTSGTLSSAQKMQSLQGEALHAFTHGVQPQLALASPRSPC